MNDLHPFIAGLPKAELHVHHVGSASPRIVAELAAHHPDSKVPTDPEALSDFFTFTDFGHFIDVYLSVVDLIRTPEDVRLLTFEIARDMARQNIRYAELTVTPFSSTRRGIPEQGFMEAIEDARKAAEAELGIVLRWCFDIPGEAGLEAAEETTRLARRPAARGARLLRPRRARDRRAPAAVQAVLRPRHRRRPALRPARRGDHGPGDRLGRAHRAARRAHRPRHQLHPGPGAAGPPRRAPHRRWRSARRPTSPPARSPTSTEHPIKEMVEAGVLVTVNSDDPPMFGTDLNNEYGVAARLLGLDERGVADLAKNAVEASFLDPAGKRTLAAEIDTYTTTWLEAPASDGQPQWAHDAPLSPPWRTAAIPTAPARTPSPRSAPPWSRARTRSRSTSASPGTACPCCSTTPRWSGCGATTSACRRWTTGSCEDTTGGGVPTLRGSLSRRRRPPAHGRPARRDRRVRAGDRRRGAGVRGGGARVLLRGHPRDAEGARGRSVRRDRPDLDRPSPLRAPSCSTRSGRAG